MLTGVNLDLVTAKTVRRELEEHFKMDLSDRKKEIGGIINEIINSEALNGSPPQGAGHPGKKEKTVPPMKKEKTEPPVRKEKSERERSPEEDDAELARRLQEEEETGGKRATRSGRQSGQKRRSSSHSKKKKKTKSKEQASDSSDSDASGSDSDSDGKGKKKVKKTATKGGYLVSGVLMCCRGKELTPFLRNQFRCPTNCRLLSELMK